MPSALYQTSRCDGISLWNVYRRQDAPSTAMRDFRSGALLRGGPLPEVRHALIFYGIYFISSQTKPGSLMLKGYAHPANRREFFAGCSRSPDAATESLSSGRIDKTKRI
jgi:hypothetical protein